MAWSILIVIILLSVSTSSPEHWRAARTISLMAQAAPPPIIVAAYPAWRKGLYPPGYLPLDNIHVVSHVFIMPGSAGALDIPDGFLMPELIEHVHAAGRKVNLGVGGENSETPFKTALSNSSSRRALVQNLTNFVVQNGYDGIEIDWEFPHTATDRSNLNAFTSELKNSLDASGHDIDLVMVVSSNESYGQWIDTATITPLVDYYLVMSFSYYGPWGTISGHNTPLYAPAQPDPSRSVSGTIDYWVNQRGVPREKTLMGLASFGMSFDSEGLYLPFNNSVQDYYNVIQDLPGQGYTEHWDTISKVPYLTQDAGAWLWSYDNPRSMGIKCQYVLKNGLAGVAIWDVTGDYDDGRQILIDRIAAELNGKHDYLPVLLRRH